MAKLFGYSHVSDEEVDERSRIRGESTHDTDRRGRHRRDRELVHDDGRRRDRRTRDSAREDDQRSGRGDRERKQYYGDEMEERARSGSSKDIDRYRGRYSIEKSYGGQREKHHGDSIYDDDSPRLPKEKSYENRRREKSGRESIYDGDLARNSMRGGESGSINDERWIAGDDATETDDLDHHRSRRRERHHRGTTDDEHDGGDDAGHPGRHSPTPDHVGHRRSHRHRSRRRSRSPSSRGARKSRSRDRSISHMARSQDGQYPSSVEQEDEYLEQKRHRLKRSPEESKRRRNSASDTGRGIHDTQFASNVVERSGDEVVGKKSHSSDDHPESDHQKASKMVDIRSRDLEDDSGVGMVSNVNASGSNLVMLETQLALLDAGNLNRDTISKSSTEAIFSLDLSTDHVQRSTSEWQSWRKSKKVKLRLKEKPMRVII